MITWFFYLSCDAYVFTFVCLAFFLSRVDLTWKLTDDLEEIFKHVLINLKVYSMGHMMGKHLHWSAYGAVSD